MIDKQISVEKCSYFKINKNKIENKCDVLQNVYIYIKNTNNLIDNSYVSLWSTTSDLLIRFARHVRYETRGFFYPASLNDSHRVSLDRLKTSRSIDDRINSLYGSATFRHFFENRQRPYSTPATFPTTQRTRRLWSHVQTPVFTPSLFRGRLPSRRLSRRLSFLCFSVGFVFFFYDARVTCV